MFKILRYLSQKDYNRIRETVGRFVLSLTAMVISVFAGMDVSAQVTFHKIWTEYDVFEDGKKGMRIHSDVTISNMMGEKLLWIVTVAYNTGVWETDVFVEAVDSKYIGKGKSGGLDYDYLGARRKLDCIYQHSRWTDLSAFIPYSAFPEGKHNYFYQLNITDTSQHYLPQPFCRGSDPDMVYFTVTRPANAPVVPQKRRKTYSDGSYADITTNPDGTETTVTYTPCNICHNRKVCTVCGGAGGRYSGFGTYLTYHLCTSCGGAGKCKYCFGTGMTVFTTTYNPHTNTTIGQDLWSGNSISSDDKTKREKDRDSQANGGQEKTRCTKCGGSGIDPDPQSSYGHSSWIARFHDGKTSCDICGKIGSHWHTKCASCNVPKN